MPQIASLFTSMTLEDQSFHVSLKKAVVATQRDVGKIQSTLSGLKTGLIGIAGAIAGSQMLSSARQALDYAASLGEVSQQLGVATRDLQLYRYIGTQVNLTEEEMDKGLQRLTRTIGEAASGSKKQATAFRELGVSVTDANGRVKTAGDVIPRLADAISQIESPTLRAKVAYDLFGKSGQQMLPLLELGENGISEFADRAAELGLVMDDSLITKADKASDRLAELNKQLEVKWASTVSQNADAILTLADALSQAAAAAGQFFTNMKGVERLQRDEGWAAGFFASWGDQATAADSRKYVAMRIKELQDATATRKRLEQQAEQPGFRGSFARSRLPSARADEIRKRDLLTAARADPEYQQWVKDSRDRKAAGPQGAGDGDLPSPSATGKKSGGRRNPRPERDRSADIERQFQEDVRQMRVEELADRLTIATTLEERAQLEADLLLEEYEQRKAQIENEKDYSKEQKAQLLKMLDQRYGIIDQGGDEIVVDQAKSAMLIARERRRLAEQAQQEANLAQTRIDGEIDMLQQQLGFARTDKERERIQLAILDAEEQKLRLALKSVITNQTLDKAERDEAQLKLDQLDALRAGKVAAIQRDNAGPLDQYLDGIAKSADELNESMERAAVDGLGDLKSGLAEVAIKGGNAFEVLTSALDRFLIKLTELAFDQAFNALFNGGSFNLFGLFGGGGGSSLIAAGGIGGNPGWGPDPFGWAGVGGPIGLPGLATGGSFRVDGKGGIDRNVLSINGKPRAMVSASERINVTPANDRGAAPSRLEIVPSKYFDVVVDGRVITTGGGMMRGRDRQAALAARQRVE